MMERVYVNKIHNSDIDVMESGVGDIVPSNTEIAGVVLIGAIALGAVGCIVVLACTMVLHNVLGAI